VTTFAETNLAAIVDLPSMSDLLVLMLECTAHPLSVR